MDMKDIVELTDGELEEVAGGQTTKYKVGEVMESHFCKTCGKDTEFHCIRATYRCGATGPTFSTPAYLTGWECAECKQKIYIGSIG